MPKIDIAAVPVRTGSNYPAPHDQPCQGRSRQALADAVGINQFGVNLMRLPPGMWTSQRHWHTHEDEFVWILGGEVVLVEDSEALLRPGDVACWPAGLAVGHCLHNRSAAEARYMVVGSRRVQDVINYPDNDLVTHKDGAARAYFHRDGRSR
jgi:uncharacterized cupin superfamily protein